jgi:hypothetical protein
MTKDYTHRALALSLAAAAALAASRTSKAGQTGDLVTISLSGSTAMRNFTTSAGFSFLTPGTSITLNAGAGGSPVTFTAPNTGTTQFQLAPSPFPAVAPEVNGLRVEWHEQGSVEGILELAYFQVGSFAGGAPSFNGGGNPVWVNRNRFTGPGSANGFVLGDFGTPTGQNPVQMAISDVNARQGFSKTGTGTFIAQPTTTGYGKGNGLLASNSISGTGEVGARQQLQPETILNMNAGSFGSGPWNTAGVDNTDNKQVAVTATLFVANPGTGLTRINRSDGQWLMSTGRLANGADFNVSERDVNSGTRNTHAVNIGLDPSWAVGENDGGDNSNGNQSVVGPNIKFSGKTAGGALRTTVQNARMGVGPLGMSDAIGAVRGPTASVTPLRALDYADSASDGSATFVRASTSSITDGSYVIWQNETYVTIKAPNPTFAGDTPAQWAARTDAETGIKGDNSGNDVADVRNNILGSVFNFPASNSVANPADQLLATSFILPQMMQVTKTLDGVGNTSPNPNYNAGLRDALINSSYAANFNVGDPSQITKGASGAKYNGASSTSFSSGDIPITDNAAGGGNWLFGNFNQNGKRDYASAVIAAQDAQAKLFTSGGGVDANGGTLNTFKVPGLAAPLANMTGSDGTTGATKGDLIVLGDYNADGKFDGRDLDALARGASLADTNTGTQLTSASGPTFGDQVRRGVLRKNAALDYLNANATAQQRTDAAINGHPENAFRKEDVNRDGLIDLKDAKLVDYYVGTDYRNINQALGAVQGADGDSPRYTQSTTRKPISLVDVEMTDDGLMKSQDFKPVRQALGTALKDGDTDFNGRINFDDYVFTDNGFNNQNQPGFNVSWSNGDFDSNGKIDFDDYVLIDLSFNNQGGGGLMGRARRWLSGGEAGQWGKMDNDPALQMVVRHAQQFGDAYINGFLSGGASVPEPATVGLLVAFGSAMLGRRRRRPI